MEIIKVKNASYSRYEELLLTRESLRKESLEYEVLYIKEFGELILTLFEKKIACIKLKKTITYCQKIVNQGKVVVQEELKTYIEEVMAEYQEQLTSMREDNERAKETSRITIEDTAEIKKIYHRIAKQLHPDINPLTEQIPELMELWQAVMTAYVCNSLKDIREAEFLVQSAIKKLNLGCTEIEIPDIEEKIKKVEEEIDAIMHKVPYQFKFLLDSSESIATEKNRLTQEFSSYEIYEKELQEKEEQLLLGGIVVHWDIGGNADEK